MCFLINLISFKYLFLQNALTISLKFLTKMCYITFDRGKLQKNKQNKKIAFNYFFIV